METSSPACMPGLLGAFRKTKRKNWSESVAWSRVTAEPERGVLRRLVQA